MAETKVDMALDDIIKAKKANIRGRGRGRGGRGARGVSRGGRGFSRGTSYTRGAGGRGNLRGSFKQTRGVSRGGFRGQSQTRGRGRGTFRGGRGTGQSRGFSRGGAQTQRFTQSAAPMQTGPTKLTITNLEYGVSDSDVKELFQEFGNMRSAAIHYDSKGQSLGTAHVVFARNSDAMKAMKQYNGVHLDGRPMKISVDGQRLQNAANTVAQRGAFRGTANRRPVKRLGGQASFRGAARGGAMRGRGNFRGNTRGSFRGTRGTFRGGRGGTRGRGGARGGRGGRGGAKKPVNVADLDAELDAYSNQASK